MAFSRKARSVAAGMVLWGPRPCSTASQCCQHGSQSCVKIVQGAVLVGACALRYRWDNEIQSRNSGWSNRLMHFKAYQMPKPCTTVYNTHRQECTTNYHSCVAAMVGPHGWGLFCWTPVLKYWLNSNGWDGCIFSRRAQVALDQHFSLGHRLATDYKICEWRKHCCLSSWHLEM